MTMTTKPGEFIFECNECGETITIHDEDDLRDAVRRIKEEGWQAVKDESTGRWEHFCPDEV